MKIYYKQKKDPDGTSPLMTLGITDCYLKHLRIDMDTGKNERKTHRHNGFEIHIIEKGYQEYEVGDCCHAIGKGEFLFVPPGIHHKLAKSSVGTEKFSITFSGPELDCLTECVTGVIPERFFENIRFIVSEQFNNTLFSNKVIENAVFESILAFLRLCGLREKPGLMENETDDSRLETAKKYIADNIESRISLDDIAAYCYVSPRQITRIFMKHEDISPAQYIIRQRIACIQKLLETSDLSLREISEKMNFKDPYYFNVFVKKYLGMPPGSYRKMNRRN